MRADQWLVVHGIIPSRARAQAEIKAGRVRLDGVPVRRASQTVPAAGRLIWADPAVPYVSRGGLKLAHGLDAFGLDPAGRIALDLGASTGGFTDVLLGRGASRVYAVDVGHGQIDPRLRADPRVVVHERTNARDLTADHLGADDCQAIVCDVSFISLTLALPPALALAGPDAWVVALIKPQFEAGRAHVGKGGVVRDAAQREAVRARLFAWLGAQPGWRLLGTDESPIPGPNGNVEYLMAARRG
ncbi:MAG: TlyA family RNA methyltransferase [Alphaproteobacteria bacterium]